MIAKSQRLEQRLATNRQQWRNQKRVLDSVNVNHKNLLTSKAKLNEKIRQNTQFLKSNARALEKHARKQKAATQRSREWKKIWRDSSAVGFSGLATASVGVAGLRKGADFSQDGIEFGAQISRVAAIARVEKGSKQFDLLKQKAKDLGITTQFSAIQAAQGMEFLTMAGFNAGQVLESIPHMLDLAKIGDLDLKNTSDIVSDIMGAFKIDASDTQSVADTIAATITSSNVSVEQLGETIKKVGPIILAAGGSLKDASALAGLLGNIGIKDEAGTVVKNLYSRLAAPTNSVQQVIDQLGIITKDDNNDLLPMVNILGQLADKTQGMGTADALAAFSKIAGLRAVAGATNLASLEARGGITEYLKSLNVELGFAKKTSEDMANNLKGDLTTLSSAFSGLKLTVQDGEDSWMRDRAQALTDLIRGAEKWTTENPKLTQSIVKVVGTVAALIAIVGIATFLFAAVKVPVILLGKGLLFVAQFGLKLAKAMRILSAVTWLFSAALWANPVTWMVVAIAALIAAVVLLYRNWEGVTAGLATLWENLKQKFAWWLSLPLLLAQVGAQMVEGLIGGIKSRIGALKESILGLANSAKTWFKGVLGINSPSRVFSDYGGNISQGLAQGIRAKAALSQQAVRHIAPIALAGGIAATSASPALASPASTAAAPVINITVNADGQHDTEQLAKRVASEVQRALNEHQTQQRSSVYDPL